MSFESLPANTLELSLADPRLAADVIDLMISAQARYDGCLAIMVCDAAGRGVDPIVLPDIARAGDLEAVASVLELVLPVVVARRGSLLVGRGRSSDGVVNHADRAWHQQAINACAHHGVPLLGFYLATRDGVVALPLPLASAS